MAIIGRPEIIIVGCGPGHPDYLTTAAHNAVAKAQVLIGARHLLELFPDKKANYITVGNDIQAVLKRMEHECQQMVVLVSGDTGLFSLARTIQKHFGAQNCRLIPGVSSVQLACARLGLDWHDMRIISAHGRCPEIKAEELWACQKIAILAGTVQASLWAADLLESMEDRCCAFACENLIWDEERILPLDAKGLRDIELASRTIILLIDRDLLP